MARTRNGGPPDSLYAARCIGMIVRVCRDVDGYCDVCGGPAGAVRVVSGGRRPRRCRGARPTAVRREPGFPPKPKKGVLQRPVAARCTGMIVDGYCDVCGSPAGAIALRSGSGSAAPSLPRSLAQRQAVERPTFPEPKSGGPGRPVRSQGAPARSSTVTATSAVVPPAQSLRSRRAGASAASAWLKEVKPDTAGPWPTKDGTAVVHG